MVFRSMVFRKNTTLLLVWLSAYPERWKCNEFSPVFVCQQWGKMSIKIQAFWAFHLPGRNGIIIIVSTNHMSQETAIFLSLSFIYIDTGQEIFQPQTIHAQTTVQSLLTCRTVHCTCICFHILICTTFTIHVNKLNKVHVFGFACMQRYNAKCSFFNRHLIFDITLGVNNFLSTVCTGKNRHHHRI